MNKFLLSLCVALIFFAASCPAATYQCSLYEVEVNPLRTVRVDDKLAQYSHSLMDKNMNLIDSYQAGDKSMLIRETPKRRIAYRVVGDFGWKSCTEIKIAK